MSTSKKPALMKGDRVTLSAEALGVGLCQRLRADYEKVYGTVMSDTEGPNRPPRLREGLVRVHVEGYVETVSYGEAFWEPAAPANPSTSLVQDQPKDGA